MKKSIGILTSCGATDNYGSILQSYALQRYLRDNYKDFEIKVFYAHPTIDITIKSSDKSFNISEWLKSIERPLRITINAYILRRKKYRERIRNQKMEMIKEAMREVLNESQIGKRFSNETRIATLNQQRNFLSFIKEYIAIHSDFLQDFKGFGKEYEADCYIVGSDQVWGGILSYGQTYGADFYTLEFLPPNHKSKKISYAASLGKAEFGSEGEKAYFKKALAKFDAISVRESCNIKTLNEIGFKAECVPDPTQLLTKSDYDKLIDSSIEKGEFDLAKSDNKVRKESVFVYMLGNETSMDKDSVMAFLESQNSVIYTNSNVDFSCAWDYKSDFAPTPQEWIACVRDCKLMITNSFHGCAFAITMNTPFVALKLGGAQVWGAMNTRFYQLFELFGLQNRLVDNLADLQTQMNEPIEWDKVNLKLKSWRNIGVEFLERNLKGL